MPSDHGKLNHVSGGCPGCEGCGADEGGGDRAGLAAETPCDRLSGADPVGPWPLLGSISFFLMPALLGVVGAVLGRGHPLWQLLGAVAGMAAGAALAPLLTLLWRGCPLTRSSRRD